MSDRDAKERRGAGDGADVSHGLLPQLLGYHLRRAQTAMFKDFADVVESEADITPGLFGMLQVIAANPGLSQSRLADAMHVDRSTIVTVIDQLERRSLVARVPSPHDKRSYSLHPTAHGAQALRRIEELVLRHEAEFTGVLSAEERTTLIRLLRRLYEPRGGHVLRSPGATRKSER